MLGLPHRGFTVGCLKALLGPLFFIRYVNDLNNDSMLDAILFADDTSLFISHNDPVYLINTLNRELNKLSTWFATNRLSLNLSNNLFLINSKIVIIILGTPTHFACQYAERTPDISQFISKVQSYIIR